MVGRMIRRVLALLVVALAAAVPSAWAQPAPARGPVLVELYTSQGCSACPRANRLLGELSHEPDVLALTFAVGYWDYLGWIDTFARPEFADRQRDDQEGEHAPDHATDHGRKRPGRRITGS